MKEFGDAIESWTPNKTVDKTFEVLGIPKFEKIIVENDFQEKVYEQEFIRPDWDQIWMSCALKLSERSVDPRLQVAALIVSGDNSRVLGFGYNGDHRGGSNKVDSLEPGQSGFIHAEENALIKFDFSASCRKIMYITTSPCKQCAKKIINAFIDEVVYLNEYRDLSGVKLLEQQGIKVRKLIHPL